MRINNPAFIGNNMKIKEFCHAESCFLLSVPLCALSYLRKYMKIIEKFAANCRKNY